MPSLSSTCPGSASPRTMKRSKCSRVCLGRALRMVAYGSSFFLINPLCCWPSVNCVGARTYLRPPSEIWWTLQMWLMLPWRYCGWLKSSYVKNRTNEFEPTHMLQVSKARQTARFLASAIVGSSNFTNLRLPSSSITGTWLISA